MRTLAVSSKISKSYSIKSFLLRFKTFKAGYSLSLSGAVKCQGVNGLVWGIASLHHSLLTLFDSLFGELQGAHSSVVGSKIYSLSHTVYQLSKRTLIKYWRLWHQKVSTFDICFLSHYKRY